MALAASQSSALPPFSIDRLASELTGRGWCAGRLTRRARMLSALQEEAIDRSRRGDLTPAAVGRGADEGVVSRIRRDRTRWLTGDTLAQAAYFAFAERIRLELNKRLLLGLFRYEAHFAAYGPGAYYRLHRDSFRGARNRVVSTVLYLNRDWRPGHGGELRLFDEAEAFAVADIQPTFGAFVAFLSEDIPHEVLEAHADRYSIAGWFRINDALETPVLAGPGLADRLD